MAQAEKNITSKSNTSEMQSDNLAVVYLRVSTKDQQEKGQSIEVQRDYAEKYAKSKDLKIIGFIEEAKSASQIPATDLDIANNLFEGLRNRPALQNIIQMASKKQFQHLIVATRDRLARNLELFVALNYYLKGKKINIHYAKPGEDIHSTNASMNRFLELVLGSIAELEANLISVRVKSGMIQRVKNNNWAGGRPPYGFILKEGSKGTKKSTLVPSIAEMSNVQQTFQFFNNYGYSYRKIAEEMNKIHNTRYWTKGKVESIITNETYTGYFIWGRRSRKNFSDDNKQCIKTPYNVTAEIIDKENTWANSLKIRNKKTQYKDPKYYNTPFLLRDKLVCGHCKEKMKTKNYGYDKYGKQREGVYRCTCGPKTIIKKTVIENLFIDEVIKLLHIDKTTDLWDYYCQQIARQKQKNLQYLDRINHEMKEKHLLHVNINKQLPREENSTLKEAMLNEKINIEKELLILEDYKQELLESEKKYYKSSDDFLSAIDKFFSIDFNTLPTERKRLTIDLLVSRVLVYKCEEDNIELNIILNSPIAIL